MESTASAAAIPTKIDELEEEEEEEEEEKYEVIRDENKKKYYISNKSGLIYDYELLKIDEFKVVGKWINNEIKLDEKEESESESSDSESDEE